MDYRVTDTELTTVADAIRAKAESEDALMWPNGFASKVASITGISSEDEGKVVQNGALVAQTSRSITENGTYDTTTNDEVAINVSASGGPIMGTDEPDPSIGSDGDYYYKMVTAGDDAFTVGNSSYATKAKTCGATLMPLDDVSIIGVDILAKAPSGNTKFALAWVRVLDASGNVLFAEDVAPVTDGQYTKVYFDSPIQLEAGKEYKFLFSDAGETSRQDPFLSVAVGNTYGRFQLRMSLYDNLKFKNLNAVSGYNSSSMGPIIPVLYDGNNPQVVQKQYRKSSGSWVQIG
jgi:hypothetical protein